MSISAMAGRRMTLSRRTAFVLDVATVTGLMAADRQPIRDSLIAVTLSGGTSNTGTVAVNGTVAGAPDSELLTFTGAGTLETVKRFSALDAGAFFTSGLAIEPTVPTISAKAIGADGSRRHMQYTVATSLLVRLDRARGSWISIQSGRNEYEKTRAYIDYTTLFTPREGDVLLDESSGLEFEVHSDPDVFNGSGTIPHHWELEVRQRKQSTST